MLLHNHSLFIMSVFIDAVDRRPSMPPDSFALHPSPDRILVVDDNPEFTMLLGMVLEGAGFRVDTSNDPLQVAALPEIISGGAPWYGAEAFDLQMPGMSGVALGRKVLSCHSGTPTLILSANPSDKVVSEFQGEYGCEVKGKPFDAGEVIDWARKVMRVPAAVH